MPRYARNKILSNFIHIMIQGINKEYIFNKEIEIKVYLKYLRERIKDTNIKIIAYCMMNNHAHFLIYYSDITEVSKLMKQINTRYAIFYNAYNNRCGIVFRNRYKAEEILTDLHLKACIKYIHNNPVKAGMCENARDYKYSSYNEYSQKRGMLLDLGFIQENLSKFDIKFEDILDEYNNDISVKFIETNEIREKNSFKNNILNKIMKKYEIKNIDEFKDNKKFLKEIANTMYFDYNYSQQEIAELININRLKIHRILNENKTYKKRTRSVPNVQK